MLAHVQMPLSVAQFLCLPGARLCGQGRESAYSANSAVKNLIREIRAIRFVVAGGGIGCAGTEDDWEHPPAIFHPQSSILARTARPRLRRHFLGSFRHELLGRRSRNVAPKRFLEIFQCVAFGAFLADPARAGTDAVGP